MPSLAELKKEYAEKWLSHTSNLIQIGFNLNMSDINELKTHISEIEALIYKASETYSLKETEKNEKKVL